jgi:hypothetical protein
MQQPTMTIDDNGNKFWQLHGGWHRSDGPALEYVNGDKFWYLHGFRHRRDGPAIERWDGSYEWFLGNQRLTFEEWLYQNETLTGEEKVMMKLQYG